MIKINDDFYIDADSNCYTLKEKTVVKDEKSKKFGEEVFKDRGYYVTLEGILNGFLKAQTRDWINKNGGDIKDLLKEVQKQNEFIAALDLKV